MKIGLFVYIIAPCCADSASPVLQGICLKLYTKIADAIQDGQPVPYRNFA